LTGDSRKEKVIEALDAGADDCLVTPLTTEELEVRLRTALRIHRLQMENSAAREALGFRASHDPLTGLWNHGAIIDLLQKQWDIAQHNGQPLGVIMLDLDHFKKINDVYGHHAGDAVLSETTRRIRSGLRPKQETGRYGGEEFLIVLPECETGCAITIAERLRRSIAERPIRIHQDIITATCSFGVASSSELLGSDPGWLVRAADAALYCAKRAGRNRVEVAIREDSQTIPSNVSDSPLLGAGRASG
jgi:diguanylate cyclase (GGDEF)-like protein